MTAPGFVPPLLHRSFDPAIEEIRRRLMAQIPRRVFRPARIGEGLAWNLDEAVPKARALRILLSGLVLHDGSEWVHASMSRVGRLPTYEDMKLVHQAVWPDGHAYQLFVPPAEHYNYHPFALHLWGRPDGARVLPDFADPQTGAV